ncbi:hypothetical protein NW762_004056 [Fusarium torreyae]|uniref:Uncharacterized protein n=1 Tax=Fusarium torreyae TaxID=1237075 RepID=A0A9W8S5B2_9HYPO|nr:hypothetical protein NW762_004056 [Fusarium torreyae]
MERTAALFSSSWFDPKHKTKVHIGQLVLIVIIASLAIGKTVTRPSNIPRNRMDMVAVTMSVKSLIVIGYQLLTEHVASFHKWASHKAYLILNFLEVIFWIGVIVVTFMSISMCDESHPTCVNCRISKRECIYSKRIQESERLAIPSTASECASASSADAPFPPSAQEGNVTVNMLHLELLHHFTVDTYVPEMDHELFDSIELVIKTGLHAPYLMVQALALSARRLSTLRHSRKHNYLDQAMKLQTHAISLFNADKSELDETSAMAKLLFSSVLGRHLLSDALAVRERELIPFLDNYVRYARLHRSVKALAGYAWPFLLNSALKDAILWGTEIVHVQPNGHECDLIMESLESSALDDGSRQACKKAIHLLQIGFDEAQRGQVQGRTMQILLWWCILVPEQFIDMLGHRQPEAIAVMGYYAALLKYGQDIWLIGDAGSHALKLISSYLGEDWADWLEGAVTV